MNAIADFTLAHRGLVALPLVGLLAAITLALRILLDAFVVRTLLVSASSP